MEIIISFHNYKKTGVAYLMPFGSKTALYIYLAPQVLAKKNNDPFDELQIFCNSQGQSNNLIETIGFISYDIKNPSN